MVIPYDLSWLLQLQLDSFLVKLAFLQIYLFFRQISDKLDWTSCPHSIFWDQASRWNHRIWSNHTSTITICLPSFELGTLLNHRSETNMDVIINDTAP